MTSPVRPRSPPAERQLEVELAQPVAQRDVAQGGVARERPERGVGHRDQRGDQEVVVDVDRPAHQLVDELRAQLDGEVAS